MITPSSFRLVAKLPLQPIPRKYGTPNTSSTSASSSSTRFLSRGRTRPSAEASGTSKLYVKLPLGGRRSDYQYQPSSFINSTARRKQATVMEGQLGSSAEQGALNSQPFATPSRLSQLETILRKPRTIPIPRWISPQLSTFTFSECFGHSSFLLVAISYAVDDFEHLRLLAVAGSSAMLVFAYFHPHGRVLWLPFKWNLLFITINVYRLFRVYADRFFASQLSPLMLHIYDQHFYVMDVGDFARLVREGREERYKQGDLIISQDHQNRYVRLVLSGELLVKRDGQITYQLHEGNFISETGLHAGLLLRGNVVSCCDVVANSDDVVVLSWDRSELTHLLEIDKTIQGAIKAVLSWDIVSKLKAQRELLSSGMISDPEIWTRKRREQTLHRYKSILSNMLAHPQYLNKRKEELCKYRDIHHVDDAEHERALKQLGWTLEEFEAGVKEGQRDEDIDEAQSYHGWNWFLHEFYLRLIG